MRKGSKIGFFKFIRENLVKAVIVFAIAVTALMHSISLAEESKLVESALKARLSEDEKKYVEEVGELVVGCPANNCPILFENEKTNELDGIAIKLFDLVSESTGLKFKYIALPQGTITYDILEALEVDILAGVAYNSINTQNEKLSLTIPYMSVDNVIVCKKTTDFSPDNYMKLGVVSGSGSIERVVKDKYPNSEVMFFYTIEDALDAVKAGTVSGVLQNQYSVNRILVKPQYDDLQVVASAVIGDYQCMASIIYENNKNSEHRLISILNKGIAKISKRQLTIVTIRETTENAYELTVWDLAYRYRYAIFVISCILLIFILVYLHFTRLRKNNLRRLKDAYKKLRETQEVSQKYQEQLEEQYEIIEALSNGYTSSFLINWKNDDIRIFKVNDEDYLELANEMLKCKNATNALKYYIDNVVYIEDKAFVRANTRCDVVRAKIRNHQQYGITYRILKGDAFIYKRMTFDLVDVKGEKNEGEHEHDIVLSFRNMTEVVEKELEQKKCLEEALRKAEEASNAKSKFLFNMSHDIRTPLNVILGFSAIAEKNIEEKEKTRDCIKKIEKSGEELLKIINNILEMSRIEQGENKLDVSLYRIAAEMKDISDILKQSVEKKKINFVVEANVKNDIYCDRLRVTQICLNLLSNAIKFTPEGGNIEFKINQISQVIDGYADYEIRVKDSGIGMKKDFLEKAFDTFEREYTSTVSGVKGTGLGLAITKSLVELMGGNIKVNSEKDKGSEFIITFCFKVQEENSNNIEDNDDIIFEGKKVLVVEDNDLNRCIAQEILSELGFLIDEAEDGLVAFEKVKALSEEDIYDLILMDIQMPIMDGYEATKAIRTLENIKLSQIPIVALTANAFLEDKIKSFEAGMNGHIAKPIDIEEMVNTLKKVI